MNTHQPSETVPIWGGVLFQQFCEALATENISDADIIARLKEHGQLRETQLLSTIELYQKAIQDRDNAFRDFQRLEKELAEAKATIEQFGIERAAIIDAAGCFLSAKPLALNIKELSQQLAKANEKCDGLKLYYEQLGAICDSDKLAIMSLQQQLATATKENTYIRGQLQSVKCPYGHKSENGVCSLGYPGCSCADDWFAAQDESNRDLIIKFKDIEAKLAVAIAERDAAIAKTSLEGYRELGRQTAEALDQRDEAISRNQSLTTLCAELAEALKACHDKMSEECIVYFEQDGKPIEIPTDIGEAYQESKMFEANLKALAHATELLKKKATIP